MTTDGQLREGVRAAYSAAADSPAARHAFPVGRAFAESLGYPADLLDALPAPAVEGFAGVSNVAMFAQIPPASRVLDLGCGAGLDSLIAARRAGPDGSVTGIDFSEAMLRRARQAGATIGARTTRFLQGDAETIPVPDDSIDVALVNGIFNLNPARDAIFRELARVVREGGAVYVAELVLRKPPKRQRPPDPSNWFA